MPPSLIRNADLCGESVVASRWTQMQAHVHAYAESWFIGTCWHAGVPAAPKALEKFSQWSLLFITKRHFFPAFRVCLSLSFFLFFFFYIFYFISFSFFDPCVIVHEKLFLSSTKNCAYITLRIHKRTKTNIDWLRSFEKRYTKISNLFPSNNCLILTIIPNIGEPANMEVT